MTVKVKSKKYPNDNVPECRIPVCFTLQSTTVKLHVKYKTNSLNEPKCHWTLQRHCRPICVFLLSVGPKFLSNMSFQVTGQFWEQMHRMTPKWSSSIKSQKVRYINLITSSTGPIVVCFILHLAKNVKIPLYRKQYLYISSISIITTTAKH